MKARRLVPFLDIAYQGFGESIEADAAAVRLFAAANLNVFVSSSFSKSFSLYGERVGALSIITDSYLPIDGIAAYDASVQKLLRGDDSPRIAAGRVVTAQALGGRGAMMICADFLRNLNTKATVAISDPSWENHRALFDMAGFEVVAYPYYDAKTNGVNFDGMLAALNGYEPGTIVVLHACCPSSACRCRS